MKSRFGAEGFLLLASVLGAGNTSTPTFCTTDKTFCISSAVQGTNVCFSFYSNFLEAGWVAMGVGSTTMSGADMYVAWRNSTNGYTIANVAGTGEVTPGPNSVQNAAIAASTPARADLTAANKHSMTFCRPVTLAKNGASITESQSYIWAISKNGAPKSNKDSASASFGEHDDGVYGSFSINFLASTGVTVSGGSSGGTPILSTSGTMTKEFVIQLHAFFMWLAWFLAPFGGVFVARYMKDYLGHYWYRIHMAVMGLGTVGAGFGGSLIIFLYTPSNHHFASNHAIIGLVAFIGMILQAFLGYICDLLYDPNRPGIPLVDRLHWWFGRAIILVAIINIQLGMTLYQTLGYTVSTSTQAMFCVFVAIGCGVFAVAEYQVGQVNHGAFDEEEDPNGHKRFSLN